MKTKKVKITLPKNCKIDRDSINTTIKNNSIVVEYNPINEKKFVPKDGDIILESTTLNPKGYVTIFKEYDWQNRFWNYCSYNIINNQLNADPTFSEKNDLRCIRPATEKEKKLLYYVLWQHGLKWNAEAKKMEKPVPKNGDIYFYKMERCPEGFIFIFEKELCNHTWDYCCYSIDEDFIIPYKTFSNILEMKGVRPATDKEKKLLFDKLKEAGYQWNAEAKKIENLEYVPKNGDIYFVRGKEYSQGYICIFEKAEGDSICDYCCYGIGEDTAFRDTINNKSYIKECRPATEAETKLLFDKLKAAGYQWNAEAKKVEKQRNAEAKKVENLEYVPKNGDIVFESSYGFRFPKKWISIFKEDKGNNIWNYASYCIGRCLYPHINSLPKSYIKEIRPANEHEKKIFFEKLGKTPFQWDAMEKRIITKKARWRAEKNSKYYAIATAENIFGNIYEWREDHSEVDDDHYNSGNYFKTREIAETKSAEVSEMIKVILKTNSSDNKIIYDEDEL